MAKKSVARNATLQALMMAEEERRSLTVSEIAQLTGHGVEVTRHCVNKLMSDSKVVVANNSRPRTFRCADDKKDGVKKTDYSPADKIRFLTLALGEVDVDTVSELLKYKEKDILMYMAAAAHKHHDVAPAFSLIAKRNNIDNTGLYFNKTNAGKKARSIWHLTMSLGECSLSTVSEVLNIDMEELKKIVKEEVGVMFKSTIECSYKLVRRSDED